MTTLSPTEHAVMATARLIAGRQRRVWLDAMEAELQTLETGRMDWALGSLVAALKDRVVREKLALGALAALPAMAAVAVLPVTAVSALLLRAVGGPMNLLGPVLVPIPVFFALLLGVARPWRHPALTGAFAFVLHQAGPALFFHFAWGNALALWGPNLAHYGIHPAVMMAGVLASWVLGTVAGARIAFKRRRGCKPSPPPP